MPRGSPIDWEIKLIELKRILIQGVEKASELPKRLKVSQPTLTRLIKMGHNDIISIGKARSTRYALIKSIPGISFPQPLYWVNKDGSIKNFGKLWLLEPYGSLLEFSTGDTQFFDGGFPFFLESIRPQGFLGRQIPQLEPLLELPKKIQLWKEEHCFKYWIKKGWNLWGNIIVGDEALELFLNAAFESTNISEKEKKNYYPKAAEDSFLYGEAGSSAGGEQPKFICLVDDEWRIVKFSPPDSSAVSVRIRDLLICEHTALSLLHSKGFQAVRSSLLFSKQRLFLETQRFDRVNMKGRMPAVSLQELDLQFVGNQEGWRETSQELKEQRLISTEDHEAVLFFEAFGELIANTDRHLGNLAFFWNESCNLFSLAPIYDMLPMFYFPKGNNLPSLTWSPKLFTAPKVIWQKASEIALEFWNEVAICKDISKNFQETAHSNKGKVKEAQERIALMP